MDKQEFDRLGRTDVIGQHEWCLARDKFLRKFWVCAGCGKKLSVYGYIWKHRWDNFRYDYRLQNDPIDSGFYCNTCVDDIGYSSY